MRTALVALLVAVPLLAACGGDDPADTATDPSGGSSLERPADVPAAPGKVRSANLATVMDTGAGAVELCLGPVAESYPPQCGGPAITNWDWVDHQDMFEQQGDVRWGTFAVTGTWDGTSFTLGEAIPGALYDPMFEEPEPLPEPAEDYSPAELETIAEDVGTLPGAQGAYADEAGHVLVDVLYDDGTAQDWADDEYGDHVVIVTPALLDTP